MNFSTKKNLLFLIRHGERADHAGLIPKFHNFDAELTELGKMQAQKMAEILLNYFKINDIRINNIKIISSPFARTIQTSKKILNVLKNEYSLEDEIEIDYFFSECRKVKDFKNPDFISFLILLNKTELLNDEIENTKINYRNQSEGIIEKTYEDIDECFIRVGKGLENIFENDFTSKSEHDLGIEVYIIVSHGEPINQINRYLKYPGTLDSDLVLYCDCFMYESDYSHNPGLSTKFMKKFSLFD